MLNNFAKPSAEIGLIGATKSAQIEAMHNFNQCRLHTRLLQNILSDNLPIPWTSGFGVKCITVGAPMETMHTPGQ